MRGKVTDQDLTDYALNELRPEERFYVESMLAVSDECRNDVYRMLDLSEMLKEGFEQEEEVKAILLNDEQRSKVLTVPRWHWRGFFQKAAAVAILAAGTAYAVKYPAGWRSDSAASTAAENFNAAKDNVAGVIEAVQTKGLAATYEEFMSRTLGAVKASDGTELQFISAPAVCTPPTLFDMPGMPEVIEM